MMVSRQQTYRGDNMKWLAELCVGSFFAGFFFKAGWDAISRLIPPLIPLVQEALGR